VAAQRCPVWGSWSVLLVCSGPSNSRIVRWVPMSCHRPLAPFWKGYGAAASGTTPASAAQSVADGHATNDVERTRHRPSRLTLAASAGQLHAEAQARRTAAQDRCTTPEALHVARPRSMARRRCTITG
jgi:hypothetical protein